MNIKKLFKSEKGTHTEMRIVKRGGKTFKRKTRVGTKEPEKSGILPEYEKYKKEYERLKAIPKPTNETIDEMFEREDKVNVARRKMNESNPKWIKEQKEYAEEQERQKTIPKIKPERIDINKLKVGMIIHHEDEKRLFEIVKVSRVNVHVLPYPSLPQIDKQQKVRKDDLKYYVEEIQKSEIVDVMKLMRGTHKEKVPVKRETGTKYEYRRVGRKSPRTGTGKMDKFPASIKKEILDQRSFGESGSKIKIIIENLIDTMSTNDQMKMESLGLINEKNKITVTSQALTDWAKKQGVESRKKRTSAAEAEKVKHEDTKKDLDRADKKISELEVRAKHNLEEIKLIQQSKQESDRIRQDLGKDNRDLKSKLKDCLLGDKK